MDRTVAAPQTIADYKRVEEAIRYLADRFSDQPGLGEVAEHVHLSPFHFQRLFKRWAGTTPKRFLQFLTVEYAKRRLEESGSVLDASLEAGLSGPGRLHDHFVAIEAMTPGEYKRGGKGLRIGYGFHNSPFGECLLAATSRGVCSLSFVDENRELALSGLQKRWPAAVWEESPAQTEPLAGTIFGDEAPVVLHLKGTNFQLNVWRALLSIPEGHLVSYADLARAVGRPRAARAVAGAVAANPVGYLIPCHRVIRQIGALGGYRWGETRKRALIGWEAARRSSGARA